MRLQLDWMSEGEPGEAKWRENDPEQMIRDGNDGEPRRRPREICKANPLRSGFNLHPVSGMRKISVAGLRKREKAGERKMIWFASLWAFAMTVGKEPPIICWSLRQSVGFGR